MKVVAKKTTEITLEERLQILSAHNEVFNLSTTLEEWQNGYLNTCLGYSFHATLYNDEEKVIGNYTAIPISYEVGNVVLTFAVASDMFIREGYRDDLNNLLSILNATIKVLQTNDIAAFYGFPNDNSNKVSLAFLRKKRIGFLDTYILPYKIGDYKKSLKVLNPLSMLFSKCMLGISLLAVSKKPSNAIIKKTRPVFEKTRFKWFDAGSYNFYEDNDLKCVWKIAQFDGIKACFLMDVYPMNPKNFNKAVRTMVHKMKSECGLFIYVGHLNFTPLSMLKIPHKFEPKTFRFDCRILDKEKLSKEDVFNINNWEVDLSSYDLL
ncbi:MAG: hypothetical protein HUK14_10025 [Muribaculaceae bacterium]|nr:hypothetical protein [Muribaculaceae bacterium]